MSDNPAMNEETLPAGTADVASAPDELAKGLPGLPVELKRGRVDERGFDIRARRHGDLLIPWSCVRGFRSFWHGSFAVLVQRPDECEVHLVPCPATRAERRLVRSAWREYVLRRVERDGELAGSYSLFRPAGQYGGAIAVGVITVAFGVLVLSVNAPTWSRALERILLRLMGATCVFAGVLGVVAGVVMRSRVYAAQLHWYRWKLTKEGLTFWPYAQETRLEPGLEDWIAPHAARLGRFTVPVEHLTFRKYAAAVLLAMGERSGARTRPLTWLQPSVLVVPMLVLWCVMIPFSGVDMALVNRLYADHLPLELPAGALLAAVAVWAIVAHVVSRGRLRRALALGRAMLERLGW